MIKIGLDTYINIDNIIKLTFDLGKQYFEITMTNGDIYTISYEDGEKILATKGLIE